jgi:D,D-heptose 1,7-bisphosphate phosphatase
MASSGEPLKKAVFIDKDGTLVRDIPFNVNPLLITLEEDLTAGLKLLQAAQYLLIIISNQSGVAHGYFEESALQAVYQTVGQLLQKEGIDLQGFYYCPHHPRGTVPGFSIECTCRKPGAGMILKAAAEWKINLANSWMIGDILNDIEAGKSAGCKSILINNGNETEWEMSEKRRPDFIAENINQAALFILNQPES